MPRILLAEDDNAVRDMLHVALERDGFEVVAVSNVRDALRYIATENFDALLSDLHMPHPGDGFTVVSAMRHTHPQAVTHCKSPPFGRLSETKLQTRWVASR
jgi:DNA-binding response OmpR family regulator